jgi:TRAP-type mannitol/chloroaromatic compound transport system permease small subunit
MTRLYRIFAWTVVTLTFGFMLNAYLTYWRQWPGATALFGGETDARALVQLGIYIACLVGSAIFVLATTGRGLRADSQTMTGLAAYVARAAFWVVFFVGLADATISFLRVEGLLDGIVGEELGKALGRNQFRGPYVHGPLVLLGLAVAAFSRSLGFIWLALLVVMAELAIVITRFVFSYEQAFMGDLVRFWYAGLFLFSSAYTLIEEGHVRVDVLYSGFSSRAKGLSNALGSLLLGMTLCAVILVLGMGSKSSIIISPILALEITQAGFGMYVKYMMAGFLGVFAVSMMIQFAAYLLESIADYRDEPGGREAAPEIAH